MGQSAPKSSGLANGFTLIEVLIVVALIGICSSMAVGQWRKVQARSVARGSVERILLALHQTRSEAVSRNRRMGLYAEADTTNNFQDGAVRRQGYHYLRFLDSDSGAANLFDPSDTVVQGWIPLEGKVFTYSVVSSGSSLGGISLVFHSDGSCEQDLSAKLGIAGFSDTFFLSLLPATGLATLENSP